MCAVYSDADLPESRLRLHHPNLSAMQTNQLCIDCPITGAQEHQGRVAPGDPNTTSQSTGYYQSQVHHGTPWNQEDILDQTVYYAMPSSPTPTASCIGLVSLAKASVLLFLSADDTTGGGGGTAVSSGSRTTARPGGGNTAVSPGGGRSLACCSYGAGVPAECEGPSPSQWLALLPSSATARWPPA